MLDSMIVISSYEQSFYDRLARLTEQLLPFLSSAPTKIVMGSAQDKKFKIQTVVMGNERDSSPHL